MEGTGGGHRVGVGDDHTLIATVADALEGNCMIEEVLDIARRKLAELTVRP